MLVVIGDSHSVIWGGKLVLSDKDHRSLFPAISVHHLGPALSYNLIDDSDGSPAPGKWGNQVLRILNETPGVTAVCLCFGEIDVRTRAVKIAIEKNMSLKDTVSNIAGRLVAFCEILRSVFNYPIFVAAPIPCGSHGRAWDPAYPAYGSERERNWATRLFTEYLLSRQRELGSFHVVSIFDQLADCTLKTRLELYADEVHLGTTGLGLLVDEFRRVVRERSLPLSDYWDPSGVVGDSLLVRDISHEVRITVDLTQETKMIVIDMGYGAFPRNLKLLGIKFDARSLCFSISGGMSPNEITIIRKCEISAARDKLVDFEIELPPSLSCRFLLVTEDSSTPFSFQDLRLEANTFLKQ